MHPLRGKLHRGSGWTSRIASPSLWIIGIAAGVLLVGLLIMPFLRAWEDTEYVTVYTSQDKVYAEQLFREFETQTGIEVRAVYDSEAVKAVGIANRLLAERARPQCDVFWNNEEMRTRQLASEGLFDEGFGWRAFGYRSRRIVVNTNLIELADAPSTFEALAEPGWRGRFALAYPLYGMTATHFMALRAEWGGQRWLEWCEQLASNEPMVVDGNSVVVRQVARGEVAVGMTDIDDIHAGLRNGYPIAAAPIASDALLVPNTVGLVAGAPRHANAARFIQWLLSEPTQKRLVELGALEGVEPPVGTQGLIPDWDVMLENLDIATGELSEVFLR